MKVAFLTLGCKVNFYETEQMMEQFQSLGFDVVDFQEKADVYIVNTCTVTNMADRKSRQMLHLSLIHIFGAVLCNNRFCYRFPKGSVARGIQSKFDF